jgi:hypothetical protein
MDIVLILKSKHRSGTGRQPQSACLHPLFAVGKLGIINLEILLVKFLLITLVVFQGVADRVIKKNLILLKVN